jgi:P27 family predicted phage terminase small subunit
MRGRKPDPKNVVPFKGDQESAADLRKAAIRRVVAKLRPKALDADLKREWNRVATILADPTVDRLKARYADAILEYCRLCVRLRALYAAFPNIADETYEADTRNGAQRKTDPRVGQRNETWRQWNSLRMELGLGPAAERNLLPGQGDLFDEADRHF